ncbi:hypothetical protein GOBAR_AA04482 [Gossypium barbadense]|uniref:Uncharacterized protein n=1 Tax=Gossypium barbadense TaxID=3634 RepID=A0A2P5YKK5_GOSBA|nr:hypothetical protein GOBAR_AA04482 [Gossypium barbadense]
MEEEPTRLNIEDEKEDPVLGQEDDADSEDEYNFYMVSNKKIHAYQGEERSRRQGISLDHMNSLEVNQELEDRSMGLVEGKKRKMVQQKEYIRDIASIYMELDNDLSTTTMKQADQSQ